jgi:heat shock 70kDa protein 1/2/6/8
MLSCLQGTNNVVIFDLGGGTFDVSVLKIKEGSAFDVLAVAGVTQLGGVDFTDILVQQCVDEFKRIHNFDLFKSKRAIRSLQQACERAKVTLSQAEKVSIDVDGIYNGLDLMVKVERGEFELLCGQLFEKTLECVRSALADAKLKPAEIDEIVLVGGSTRIPKIRELLRNLFGGKQLNSAVHPDEAVAHGAAIQAAILSGTFCNNFGKLNDVTPLSLGIKTVPDNAMSVIIGRNTKIPHKNTQRYYTAADFQTSLRFMVYEGERPFVADNQLLGVFYLNNLTRRKKGETQVDVQFALDENGILIVTATEVGNANTASIRIDHISGRMSKDAVDKMMREAEKYREFDEERVFCTALRQQMANYITNCFNDLAEIEDMDTLVIQEVANECAVETKWLKSNPQALKSDVQLHFDRLKAVLKTKMKPKTRSSQLSKIYKTFRSALKYTNDGSAPSTSSSGSADGMNIKEEPVDADIIVID